MEFTRDSVCMGDDIDAPHARIVDLPPGSTLAEALGPAGPLPRYLASASGAWITWAAEAEGRALAEIDHCNAAGPRLELRLLVPDGPLTATRVHFVHLRQRPVG
ncbi:hypothetical protein ACQ5SO_12005 [Rhodovulum sp. DZ06]|uniref:hypothetical protein n=1 Tax=Rhodovulum sp. DZ06 TaxID=3425126 RepID=UPI003D33B89C